MLRSSAKQNNRLSVLCLIINGIRDAIIPVSLNNDRYLFPKVFLQDCLLFPNIRKCIAPAENVFILSNALHAKLTLARHVSSLSFDMTC